MEGGSQLVITFIKKMTPLLLGGTYGILVGFVGVNKMIEDIKKVIEEDVNPYLAMHSGGCELVDYVDGVVTIRLFGGCSGCPSSHITLFNGIVPILKEKIPEIQDVELE